MIETSYFDHIVLFVKDQEYSKQWYRDVLDMELARDQGLLLFLACGQLQELGITEGTGNKPHQLDPDTELNLLRFTTEKSRESVLANMKGHGVKVHSRPDDPEGIYFQDPSGHWLQLVPSSEQTCFDKVILYVTDTARAKQFYMENFGFKVERENKGQVTLKSGEGHQLGLLLRPEGVTSYNGLHHLGFVTYLGSDGKEGDYSVIRKELDQMGLKSLARRHTTDSLYVDDPDGHQLQFHVAPPEARARHH